MLRKRIIFTLVYENGFFNQSRNFRLQKVGNISWLEKNYKFKDIAFSLDELIVLNASKDKKNIQEFGKILSELVNDVFIPIAAGGGIRTVEDAKFLFENGADKLVINTILYENLSKVATAWVVDRVDITAQAARRVATERRAYVLNKLKEKQEQVDTSKIYEYLAAVDPEAKVLLEELKDFGVSLPAINK